METLACRDRPWADLPDPILENILERLPLSGYVRFSAVCRPWLSVQTTHRRRHSPSPPPMLRLPWLISSRPRHKEALSCYSPFEDKFFTLPVPFEDRSFSSHNPYYPFFVVSFDHGWLLSRDSGNLILWNPISGDKIQLPQLIHGLDGPNVKDGVVAISPPPHYLVSIARYPSIFLLRWFDSDWVVLKLPEVAAGRLFQGTVSISGKHYRAFSRRSLNRRVRYHDLMAVDALASPPTSQLFAMAGLRQTGGATHLVEFGEEPLLVMEILEYGKTGKMILEYGKRIPVGFEVYRADLDRKMWVKVESVGDNRVIMIHWIRSVSLVAADIGARGNCIYFTTGENTGQGQWNVFDLGTGRVSDLQLPNASQFQNYAQLFFVPSLC